MSFETPVLRTDNTLVGFSLSFGHWLVCFRYLCLSTWAFLNRGLLLQLDTKECAVEMTKKRVRGDSGLAYGGSSVLGQPPIGPLRAEPPRG